MEETRSRGGTTGLDINTSPDVVVIGAGFAGIYAAIRFRSEGLAVQGFEAGDDVGGTWYWNRYPGARCDVESVDYSYSFCPDLQQEWVWSERYASQPEILEYLRHVATRFDVRRSFRFGIRVTRAVFDERDSLWTVSTDADVTVRARFFVLATGCLSSALSPDIPGLDEFGGRVFHTAKWPHEGVAFQGERVALIGTGSSGIQAMPLIASEAGQITIFQRSANYSIPMPNRPLGEAELTAIKADYAERRRISRQSPAGYPSTTCARGALEVEEDVREQAYETGWQNGGVRFARIFPDQLTSLEANATAAAFVRRKIKERVRDPHLARELTPQDHPIGSKRICTDVGYFEAFNRENVFLVNLRSEPIQKVTAEGIETSARHYLVDTIVLATGFDAMTGSILKLDIIGRGGIPLRSAWRAGPRTYLGLGVAAFPNLFIVTGPGSPSVLANMVLGAEQHVDWIADCITYLRDHGHQTIEPSPAAQDDWVAHANELAEATLLPKGNSWYLGANIQGKPRVFMPYVGGFGTYREICDKVALAGYTGFLVDSIARSPERQADDPS